MSILGPSDRLAAALAYLGQTIDARAEIGDASSSWTAKLLSKGKDACADKAAEEAGEFVAAVRGETDDRVASEAADMLYHALVALRVRGVSLDQVAAALEKRQGMSGIDEKAGRKG
ncbi:MAG: phosphoribosyl-ATP diphosphatase [Hyphomonas sp.]|nr:phosphoribosyl-ATP diphosphatase [Hyphomonas sp.]